MKKKDLNGIWDGIYILNTNIYKNVKNISIPFTATIKSGFFGFSGNITEDLEKGGIDDIAQIKGKLKDGKIYFTKKYKKLHVLEKDGTRKTYDDRSPSEINYKGIYNPKHNTFTGTWEINREYVLNGKRMRSRGNGTWTMKKRE